MKDYFLEQLLLHHLEVPAEQQQKLQNYIKLLQRWNKAYNLIANAATKEIVDRHIIDSLLVMPYLQGPHIIDVGTGAGLPGIPLAILFPHYQFTLLDSNGKKTRFITQAKVELSLTNVAVVQMRVENYHPSSLFNTILSRAFAKLNDMLSLTKHLCAPEGKFIALKGEGVNAEIPHLDKNFHCELITRLPFADADINRQVVILQGSKHDM